MRKFSLFAFFIFVFASTNLAQQKIKLPIKTSAPKTNQTAAVKEIAAADWKLLVDALQAEDWKTSARLASVYLEKLKVDNDKKQLARLRYFYLYSLAGQILTTSTPSEAAAATDDSEWKALDSAVSAFNGKELVLPPHRFQSDCTNVLNYICAVKSNERALRVTATNQAGTMIHSFEYVLFPEKIELNELAGKELFLGGKLNRVEFNQDSTKLWVMRLFFVNGFVSQANLKDK